MRFRRYIRDKTPQIMLLLGAVFLSALFLWLLDIRRLFILFFEMLFIMAFFAGLLLDFYKRYQYYNELIKNFESLDEKTLFSEIAERAAFTDGEILYDIISQTDKYMNDKIEDYAYAGREYREYIEMWVHEIKTPITSASLMIENDKNITTLNIKDELMKIDGFVKQALYYARSTTLEKDFKVESSSLNEIVISAVKQYSKPIIQAYGHVYFENLDNKVYADKKWCTFIIGQLIANSVKYRCDDLQIHFSSRNYKNGVILSIRDNGVGIPEEDITRIFDKGFTGENGRHYNKSTGIGLYLCKKLCLKMNMDISVSSKKNEGTIMNIYFPKNSLFM